ncbi:type II secretion system protein N [Luteimonas kalidii]|uniref:Type II secretion system protein N n=1 Tax=Luteimonas kalidii TaxID=3042025 RepID=A0ABT6JQU1_9GAMM|nr:type II secretion system protein N [Luteimonas kalidii]MDH5832875.1 type II secretion system protein N [Luteimonas kalidii]
MSRRRLVLWFAAALVSGTLAFAPLQLVLPRLSLPAALSATRVEGPVWRGHLRQLHWQATPLGDVRLGLSPLPLLAGHRQVWMQGPDVSLRLHTGHLRGLDGASGVVPLPAPSGLSLRASLEEAGLLFDDGGCREAGGRVRLELALADDAVTPMILSGTPACEGRRGVLALAPEQAGGPLQFEARLEIDGDGGYRIETLARSDDPALRMSLLAAGFQQAPGGFSRVDAGTLAD